MELYFPMGTRLEGWERCKRCNADLRSGRHARACDLAGSEANLEIQRVRSVIRTMSKIKKPSVIIGGKGSGD